MERAIGALERRREMMKIQEAIEWMEAFKKTYNGYPAGAEEAADMAIEALRKMLEDVWTPFKLDENGDFACKTPERSESILISDGEIMWMDTFMEDESGYYLQEHRGDFEGLAWQPLPEQWEGEDDNR